MIDHEHYEGPVSSRIDWRDRAEKAEATLAQVHRYATELFAVLAPQCSPLEDAVGVMTQIDNALCGITKRYCKEGETPQQRVERYHKETLTLMQMLADEKGKTETARAALAASEQKCAELAAALKQIIDVCQLAGSSIDGVKVDDIEAILAAYRAQVERETLEQVRTAVASTKLVRADKFSLLSVEVAYNHGIIEAMAAIEREFAPKGETKQQDEPRPEFDLESVGA